MHSHNRLDEAITHDTRIVLAHASRGRFLEDLQNEILMMDRLAGIDLEEQGLLGKTL